MSSNISTVKSSAIFFLKPIKRAAFPKIIKENKITSIALLILTTLTILYKRGAFKGLADSLDQKFIDCQEAYITRRKERSHTLEFSKLLYSGKYEMHEKVEALVTLALLSKRHLGYVIKDIENSGVKNSHAIKAALFASKKSPESFNSLASMRGNPDDEVKITVARALAQYGNASLDLLIEMYKANHENNYVLEAIIEALGEIKTEENFIFLLEQLNYEEEEYIRKALIIAIGSIGIDEKHAERAYFEIMPHSLSKSSIIREGAAIALGRVGTEEALNSLQNMLEDQNDNVQASAIKSLGKLGGNQTFSTLFYKRGIKPENHVRETVQIRDALEKRTESIYNSIFNFINDPKANIRAATAEALGNFKDIEALDILAEQAEDIDDSVRLATIKACTINFGRFYYMMLEARVARDNIRIKIEAIKGLGEIGTEGALDTLKTMLTTNLIQRDTILKETVNKAIKVIELKNIITQALTRNSEYRATYRLF
jgi:HEAT repeat protein